MDKRQTPLRELAARALAAADAIRQRLASARAGDAIIASAREHVASSAFPEPLPARQTVDVSAGSVARATLVIIGILALAWLVVQIQSILVLFFIASCVAITINPLVTALQRYRIPRAIGALLIYIVFFSFIGIVISSFIPILTKEIPSLISSTLEWVDGSFNVDTTFISDQILQVQNYLVNVQQNLSKENVQMGFNLISTIGQNALAVFKSVAGGIVSLVLVLVIAFFMVLEEGGIRRFFLTLFPSRYHDYIVDKSAAVSHKFGAWARGIFTLMVIMGALSYAVLSVLGVNYALSLALLVAMGEMLPYVGPFIALAPAVIVAASQGGMFLAGVVFIAYIAMQQIENNVAVPLVFKKAVGLSPVATMFAMFVGASFPQIINPIVGILLAIPLATVLSVFVTDYTAKEK